jgi:hypothetical protein
MVTSCGCPKKGYQLLLGQHDTFWPGCLTLQLQLPGRIFYAWNLALATLTIGLVLASVYRREALREPRIVRCLFPIAGTISLLFLSDFSALGFTTVLAPQASRYGDPLSSIIFALPLLLILVSFLRPEFWRMKGFVTWAFFIGAALFFLVRLDSLDIWDSEPGITNWVPYILYVLVPLGVWYWFGLSGREERRTRWKKIRPRVHAFYAMATLFACVALVYPGLTECHLWGLLAYFVGIQLISLGYMQLWREANPLLSHGQVFNEYEEQ